MAIESSRGPQTDMCARGISPLASDDFRAGRFIHDPNGPTHPSSRSRRNFAHRQDNLFLNIRRFVSRSEIDCSRESVRLFCASFIGDLPCIIRDTIQPQVHLHADAREMQLQCRKRDISMRIDISPTLTGGECQCACPWARRLHSTHVQFLYVHRIHRPWALRPAIRMSVLDPKFFCDWHIGMYNLERRNPPFLLIDAKVLSSSSIYVNRNTVPLFADAD
jgi:hypothetical protein